MSVPDLAQAAEPVPASADPYLWLEEVDSPRALAWVRDRNARTLSVLMAGSEYSVLQPKLRAVLDSQQRIPYVSRMGPYFYNFWQDAEHKRGLWRRTTLAQFRLPAPAWETVLDLDALAAAEGENWVWHGATCLPPARQHCLINLSRGGGDAHVVREFDLLAQRFVAVDSPGRGFVLPEAKSEVHWLDADTVLVGTDFGPGSLTSSGYPRTIREWRRGTPLSAAKLVFEGDEKDVAVDVSVDLTPGVGRVVFSRSLDFYRSVSFLQKGDQLVPLVKPDDASLSLHRGLGRDWALLRLRSDYSVGRQRFAQGSLIVARLDDLLVGRPQWTALFTPSVTRSLSNWSWTRSRLLLTVMDQVANRLEELHFDGAAWQRREVAVPGPGTLSVAPLHDVFDPQDALAEHYFLNYADFLTPDSLMLAQTSAAVAGPNGNAAATGAAGDPDRREVLKARERFFDASMMKVEQRFATSPDGERVPYFVVRSSNPGAGNDTGQAVAARPTLLYGYGGFEVSLQPWYSGAFGVAWFERGGVLVVANIRGGGEFGPRWHQAAVKAHKQRSYDDFLAVAQDLIATGITTPAKLGIMGGSNGGLLVGAAMTQRPDLFGAVVCQVPLLDMQRYHRMLAGASWMAEYGNPDVPEEWAVIARYSPYQNVQPGKRYPRVLFTTSTRDDRVHPGHARKMVARMTEQGHEVLYFENTEGGHAGAADNEQRAHLLALEYAYLWQQLGAATPAGQAVK